jgi:hypothetical protein
MAVADAAAIGVHTSRVSYAWNRALTDSPL